MAKYINILLLFVFVAGTTIDFAVLDSADFQDDFISDNHQNLSLNIEHGSNLKHDMHCAGHCLHHFVMTSSEAVDYTIVMNAKLVPYGNLEVEFQSSKPAIPPPLFYFS